MTFDAERFIEDCRAALGEPRKTLVLGDSVIHGVAHPLATITAAIHVSSGAPSPVPRSEWDPETFAERPFDGACCLRLFADANSRLEGSA